MRVIRDCVPALPQFVADIRRFARTTLPPGCPVLDDVELLLGEMGANAVQHSEPLRGSALTVVLEHGSGRVRGEVHDTGGGPGPRLCGVPDLMSESGRGLYLVDLLAEKWGSAPATPGRLVWFELHDPACCEHGVL